MNVLEKILEEIDKKRESLIDMSNDEPELCDVEDWYDEGVDNGKIKAYCDAMEIILSHMDEVTNMSGKRLIDANALDDEVMNFFLAITGNPKQTTVVRECKESFRRMIDEQPTIYADSDWISVSERLPEVGEKCIITDKCCYVHDGIIYDYAYDKDENPSFHRWDDEYWQCFRPDVIAWQSLPEPYKPDVQRRNNHVR